MLKHLDLFSGIGGFSLGLERTGGFETVAFCEIDPFCQKVLKKHWPDVPIHEDVRSLEYDGPVDIITGGYPCQPFSSAGKRKGTDDDRHLWPAMFSLIKKHRPAWVIGENVAGHISMGLDDVLADLESKNYTCQTFVIPACAVDAPHRRDRVWIIANNDSGGQSRACTRTEKRDSTLGSEKMAYSVRDRRNARWHPNREPDGPELNANCEHSYEETICNTTGEGFPDWAGGKMGQPCPLTEFERSDGREIERNFRGISHGVSRRVDRLKSLGNAVVSQIPEIIGYAILEAQK